MDSVSLIEDGDEEDDGASFSSSHSSSIFSSKVKFLTLSKSACSETAGNCEEANHSAVRLSCEAGDGVALFPSKKCGCCCGVGNENSSSCSSSFSSSFACCCCCCSMRVSFIAFFASTPSNSNPPTALITPSGDSSMFRPLLFFIVPRCAGRGEHSLSLCKLDILSILSK